MKSALSVITLRIGLVFSLLACLPQSSTAADEKPFSRLSWGINSLGLGLYRVEAAKGQGNLLLSPYSLELALAMVSAGADGETRQEMLRVLRIPANDEVSAQLFAGAAKELGALMAGSKVSTSHSPLEINVANRLFVQSSYSLRESFVKLLADGYKAPLDQLDFASNSEAARAKINDWVEQETREKIRDLIPAGNLSGNTRLVLVNALYIKAAWQKAFESTNTKPARFFVNGKTAANVPTMRQLLPAGYAKRKGFTAVRLPYADRGLALLILLPETPSGLPQLEKALTAELLTDQANLPHMKVWLELPKFRIAGDTMRLKQPLQSLGMKTAFERSANFERMTPRAPNGDISIGEVFHKTYIDVDEKGTEAAAATAVEMVFRGGPSGGPIPPEVRVDRPFVFAIQHMQSGTCLFLGRVMDPR